MKRIKIIALLADVAHTFWAPSPQQVPPEPFTTSGGTITETAARIRI